MPSTYHIPLKKLGAFHYKIIVLHLKGWKNKDIQADLSISHNTVCHTLLDPKARATIQRALAGQLESFKVLIGQHADLTANFVRFM